MMKKHILTLATLLSSSALIPCGDYPDPDYSYYNFFEQERISDPSLFRFLVSAWGTYIPKDKSGEPIDQNIADWRKYWGGAVSEESVRNIVYASSLEDMKAIQKNIKKPSALGEWANNDVVQYCATNKETASLSYLTYANKCEPFLGEPEFDWETYTYMPRNEKPMLALAVEGEKAYAKEKKPELKMRYAFQVVRLYHYAGKYEQAISAFDKMAEPLGIKDYMYFRALEQKAGALNRQNHPQAPYLYAKVFAECPDRRDVALQSFSWTNEMNWEPAYKMCQDKREQTTFYAMRGLQASGFPVEEMENIVQVDPSSPYLELLLARQINLCERFYFPMYNEYAPVDPVQNDPALPRMQTLARQQAANATVKNRDFWNIVDGYLSLFQGHATECRSTLMRVPLSSAYYQQAQILDFVAQVLSVKDLDSKTELQLVQNFNAKPYIPKHPHTKSLLMDELGKHYYRQKEWAKSFLCHNSIVSLSHHLDIKIIDALIDYVQRKDHTVVDKMLLDNGSVNENTLSELLQMRGTYHLERGDYNKAISTFQQLPVAYRKTDPQFNKPEYLNKTIFSYVRRNPTYNGYMMEDQSEPLYTNNPTLDKDYNKLILAQTLQHLEQRAQARPDSAATYYFILGCAWTNITAYGWHRPVLSYYNDNYNYSGWGYAKLTAPEEPNRQSYDGYSWYEYHYYNPTKIMEYYDKAYAATQDPELRAKITFAAAQVEQWKYYADASGSYQTGEYINPYLLPHERPNYQKYFSRLKNELNNTKYYQEVLQECYYLAVFADN